MMLVLLISSPASQNLFWFPFFPFKSFSFWIPAPSPHHRLPWKLVSLPRNLALERRLLFPAVGPAYTYSSKWLAFTAGKKTILGQSLCVRGVDVQIIQGMRFKVLYLCIFSLLSKRNSKSFQRSHKKMHRQIGRPWRWNFKGELLSHLEQFIYFPKIDSMLSRNRSIGTEGTTFLQLSLSF